MSPRKKSIVKRAHDTKKVHCSWSACEKLMVIYYFEHIQKVRETARRFDIEPKQVHDWLKKKQELLNAALYVLTLNRDRQA
ncbi:10619_t:CDS:1, partial [Racocetra fulgida]